MCDSPAEALGDAVDAVRDLAEDVYNQLEGTYNSIEDEAVDFYKSTYYIVSGEKDRDQRRLSDKANDLNNIANQLTAMQDRLGNKVFLEQIFKYGDIRRIKNLGTSYEELVKEYEQLLADYKNNTDLSFISSVMLFTTNVMSALVYNILDYIKTGDSASLRTAISIGLLIAAIVVALVVIVGTAGAAAPTMLEVVAACLVILSSILALDSMVNNSGLLGSAFKILDLVLNETLHLDKILHTEGFDSDSQYYQSMMNNTRLVVQIASIAASVGAMVTTPSPPDLSTAAGRMAARNADFNSYAGGVASGQTITIQTSAGIAASKGSSMMQRVKELGSYKVGGVVSLSDIYDAYGEAMKINDVYGALTLRAELGRKLEDSREIMQKKINKDNRRKMEGSYSDVDYIMNQTDMAYHSYILQMSEAGHSDYFDPQGTIVMNTRYRPTKSFMYGFEDMFQYDNMAGGQMYVYNTLWK